MGPHNRFTRLKDLSVKTASFHQAKVLAKIAISEEYNAGTRNLATAYKDGVCAALAMAWLNEKRNTNALPRFVNKGEFLSEDFYEQVTKESIAPYHALRRATTITPDDEDAIRTLSRKYDVSLCFRSQPFDFANGLWMVYNRDCSPGVIASCSA